MAAAGEFGRALAAAVASGGSSSVYRISRNVWGNVLEPLAQRSGSWVLRDGDVVVEVSRLDSLYGYLRVRVGGCLVEGVVEYRQWFVVFRPQRVEGGCRPGPVKGIEAVEED